MPAHTLPRFALSAIALAVSSTVCAQTQVVRPPIAQYWMDVSTVSMAGMPAPGAGDISGFGATQGIAPGRWLDIAVATQRKPEGAQAIQAIPPTLAMGGSLTLVPVQGAPSQGTAAGTRTSAAAPEMPKGRILLYWGCSDTVRSGQPRVLEAASADAQVYAKLMAERGALQIGAVAATGHAIWPNASHRQTIPKNASLVGKHAVVGEGLPASLRFELDAAQDFMPPLALSGGGGSSNATMINWAALPTARAYFLNAMASSEQDMIVWSSSEEPEPGGGLINYVGNANLEKWLADKVLLPTSQNRCAIPAGIFDKADGAMVQGIAYGHELHLAYPPRPADRQKAWEPEWTAQIRVKSIALLPLERGGSATKMEPQKPLMPAIPGLPNIGGALKGLFGR